VVAAVGCGRFGFGDREGNPDGSSTGDDATDGSGPALKLAYLKASNTETFDRFGYALALSADGTTLATSAPAEDGGIAGINASDGSTNNISQTGAVYIFVRVGDTWQQQAYIKPATLGMDDLFGSALALSFDGNTLAVGMPSEDSAATTINGSETDNSAPDAGAVLVFSRAGQNWSQTAYIKCANCEGGDQLGWSVALSGDGNTLAAGANGEDSADGGVNAPGTSNAATNSGAAYVFTRAGATWSQQAYIKAWNTTQDDDFGYAVSLSSDGNTLAVGARGEDSSTPGIQQSSYTSDDAVQQAGAAYVFTRAGTAWTQEAYIKSDFVGFGGDFLGESLSLSSDGNVLVCGAPGEDSLVSNSGAAWVFRRSGATWTQEGHLKASNPGDNDQFGSTVAIAGGQGTILVSAPMEDGANDASADTGAVYSFARQTTWTETAFTNMAPDAGDQFGFALAISADSMTRAATANFEDSAATGVDGDPTNNGAIDSGCAGVTFY
jgi:trimeric autotransporter adhesin